MLIIFGNKMLLSHKYKREYYLIQDLSKFCMCEHAFHWRTDSKTDSRTSNNTRETCMTESRWPNQDDQNLMEEIFRDNQLLTSDIDGSVWEVFLMLMMMRKKENFAFDCNIFQNLIVLSSGSVQFEIANRTEV